MPVLSPGHLVEQMKTVTTPGMKPLLQLSGL
jgi:hypothetical protein